MDNGQANLGSEKKLGVFTSVYKESVLSKPQDVNITITPTHIFGVAYLWEQKGTKENGPDYMRFTCGLEEITKIDINTNNRNSPIYIQCDDTSKSVVDRKRIILPNFDNNEEIVKIISDAKAALDQKLEKKKEEEKNQKIKELESRKKASDDEFESMTSGYKELQRSMMAGKAEEKPAPAPEPKPAPAPAPKPAPAPAPEPKPAPAPAPEPKPAPAPESKPAPAPAPKPEPKPAPAPAPAPNPEPKPAPAPAPAPNPESKPAPVPAPAPKPEHHISEPIPFPEHIRTKPNVIRSVDLPETDPYDYPEPVPPIEEPPKSGSVTVDDIVGLDEFLGIHVEESTSESYMDDLEDVPDEAAIEAMPEEILQKQPAEIEELVIPEKTQDMQEIKEPKIVTGSFRSKIEELDPSAEIAKKLAPKPEPVKTAPEPEPEPEIEPEPILEKSGVEMSLDEFETAMKKLKSMLDNGVITQSEFAQEKRKLLSTLY